MVTDFNALRERYSSLNDDELLNLAVSGGLTEEALQTLNQELRRRGIHDTTQYQQHLERFDRDQLAKKQKALVREEKSVRFQARIGYGVALFGVLLGLYRWFGQHDKTNGIAILIASAALSPIIWALTVLHRLIWRFLLRP
jgi:hypothetical protein